MKAKFILSLLPLFVGLFLMLEQSPTGTLAAKRAPQLPASTNPQPAHGTIDEGSVIEASQVSTPTLALMVPSSPQPTSDTIDVPIMISGAENLAGFEVDLLYNRSLVTVAGMTLNNFLGQTSNCEPNSARCAVALGPLEQTYATSVGAYSYGTGNGADGSGTLAVLHLQPTGTSGTTTLRLVAALVADVEGNPTTPATEEATLVLGEPLHTLFLPAIQR